MTSESGMAKESQSTRLVRSLEAARGCVLQVANRRSGFNGLSVCEGTVVRKIELKTVINTDYWFAINGLYGIQSLFFDPQYYLYFVLANERKVLIVRAAPFLQTQIPAYNTDVSEEVNDWLAATRKLCSNSGLNIIARVNFKLKTGIRKIVSDLEAGIDISRWNASVDSIWQADADENWTQSYP